MPPSRHRGRHLRRVVKAAALAGGRRLLRTSEADDRAFGEALLAELDTMKGMAMKVGQILSYMDGAVPEETQVALAHLQRGIKPVDYSVIESIIEESFGMPVQDCFERFDVESIAAASIGQVHRASFEGREVAVKLQYPNVRATFETDFRQLGRLSRIASLATRVDGQAIVNDLRARVIEECDYHREAHWVRWFGEATAGLPDTRLPQLVAERCTDRVLTTTWCDGVDLATFIETSTPAGRARAALALARFTWSTFWALGTLHADPHPGNQLYADDGSVAFLDFGCVRRFDEDYMTNERRQVTALLDGDRPAFRRAVLDSGIVASQRRFDWDEHWAMQRHAWGPYLQPSFTFDPAYQREGLRFSGPTNPNLRKLAIPPEWIWLQRVQWGLHSVLTRMNATGAFAEVLREALQAPAPTLSIPAPKAA